ncbi:ANTAR domain-containing response regulator [Algicella marina]|uniref:ANTAR domain-containing protein n=1 Tax=Algicella marina TaxID=2683284 RepID=A0A6P1T1R4_9RHOB|nr:ANTAR domain-containing protein [Algicella marina]QHQ36854.1 ANTAR domain-containing protein [Algicella marina]
MEDLHIVVIETNRDRAGMIVEGLRQGDDIHITVISEMAGLARRLRDLKPDIVLIDLANPSRDILSELATATEPSERPVAMFVDQSDKSMMTAALEAGVSAYVVDGLKPERIRSVMETAIARFHAFSRLRAELAATKAALEERKTIDRAKGLLMKLKNIGEEEAYALLRKTAMDQGKRVADVAASLVTTAGLLR